MKKIPLSPDLAALIDDEDFIAVSKKTWRAYRPPGSHTLYAKAKWRSPDDGKWRHVYLHRFIFNMPKSDKRMVDHINGDPLDNRRSNLRFVTHKQNMANRRGGSAESGFKGVSLSSKDRWMARIGKNGHEKLGIFDAAADAARAYDDAAREKYGQFARLNFPNAGENGCLSQIVHPNSFLLHDGRRMESVPVVGGVSPPASSPIIGGRGSVFICGRNRNTNIDQARGRR